MSKSEIIHETHSEIEKIYRKMVENKNQFGVFHKCLFHLHTSESHDYRVIETNSESEVNSYKGFSEQDIFRLCVENRVFPSSMSINDLENDKEDFRLFSNAKESMMFLLIASKLIENMIALVVVSDHNTILGYDKLKKAISLIASRRAVVVYPELILGVEISCADKIHVVGIFPDEPTCKDNINRWIKDNIMSEIDGTFATSLAVMKWIDECGGIPYLAHINSSDMFKKEKFLTGAYKKHLFGSPFFHVVGLSDINKKEFIAEKLAEHSTREFCYVLDSDSHAINTIGDQVFWIKGSQCSFEMIKSAFRDYTISIEHEAPKTPDKFIKGLLVDNRNGGFLKGKDITEQFELSFSDALNCFIGGRGTGKSTILNIIEVMLTQRFPSKEILEAMCEYYAIWVLFFCNGKEYLISFLSPERESSRELFVRYFDEKRSYHFGKDFEACKGSIAEYMLKNYIEIYELESNTKPILFSKITQSKKRDYLNNFFNRGYSINELVQTAGSGAIHDYILKTMEFDEIIIAPGEKFRNKTGLEKYLMKIEDKLASRKAQVLREIEQFNERQVKKLRITYEQNNENGIAFDFEKVLSKGRSGREWQYYKNFNVSVGGIADFLWKNCKEMTAPAFFLSLIKKEYEKINFHYPLVKFSNEVTRNMVEKGIVQVDDETYLEVLKYIQIELIEDNFALNEIIEYFRSYISKVEEFDLEFNIYNKEDLNNSSPVYKKIKLLSLGQKVVAMLSFILGYSDFSKDYRPLLIDQPEDNLDNRYIFKNLVADLREVKLKRQVIVATHNATIVTNAKADQVVVLDSDGLNGWVLARGFPNELIIKKHIVNYLEGGEESFEHKCFIYEDIFGENRLKRLRRKIVRR